VAQLVDGGLDVGRAGRNVGEELAEALLFDGGAPLTAGSL
jgi:hypothetical protein